jgi:hypothetical protein
VAAVEVVPAVAAVAAVDVAVAVTAAVTVAVAVADAEVPIDAVATAAVDVTAVAVDDVGAALVGAAVDESALRAAVAVAGVVLVAAYSTVDETAVVDGSAVVAVAGVCVGAHVLEHCYYVPVKETAAADARVVHCSVLDHAAHVAAVVATVAVHETAVAVVAVVVAFFVGVGVGVAAAVAVAVAVVAAVVVVAAVSDADVDVTVVAVAAAGAALVDDAAAYLTVDEFVVAAVGDGAVGVVAAAVHALVCFCVRVFVPAQAAAAAQSVVPVASFQTYVAPIGVVVVAAVTGAASVPDDAGSPAVGVAAVLAIHVVAMNEHVHIADDRVRLDSCQAHFVLTRAAAAAAGIYAVARKCLLCPGTVVACPEFLFAQARDRI